MASREQKRAPRPASPGRRTAASISKSLRDGREVFIYGERVKDVTTHPAFRNTARMVARLYDALHDPKHADKILVPTDTGNGGMTHAFFKAPKSLEDLLPGRNAIAEWAKITYGWIGRCTRLQGVVPGDARRQCRVLRSLPGERETLVQVQPGARAVRQPRHHPSAGRPRPAAERGRPTSAVTSRRRPTPASSSPAPRWWRPDRC